MDWRTITAILCIYGAIKEFRPATPFLTPFLVGPTKNLTLDEVYSQVYPYWTYSYMLAMIPVFILTDLLQYRPIIRMESIGLVITWAFLVFGTTLHEMQVMQVTFGVSSASEIAYYSYIYSVIDVKHYKKATSYIRTAALIGKLLAFGLGQYLISTHSATYLTLNQISLGAVTIVAIIALFFPRVKPKPTIIRGDIEINEQLITRSVPPRFAVYMSNTWKDIRAFTKNRQLLKWSLWWALASCGMYQIQNYMQSLWNEMQTNDDDVANGIVEFSNSLIGAILSFSIQYLPINWARFGESILAFTSILVAILLYICSQTTVVLHAYVAYVVICSIYHMLITAASTNVAKQLSSNNHGLIFGCNTFVAVCLQSLLTCIVVDSRFLHFDIRQQFVIYAAYFGVVALVFVVFSTLSLFKKPQVSNSP